MYKLMSPKKQNTYEFCEDSNRIREELNCAAITVQDLSNSVASR